MRISDWSSDVCSSDLLQPDGSYRPFGTKMWISGGDHELSETIVHLVLARTGPAEHGVRGLSLFQIGRASCRERGGQYVSTSVVDVSLKKRHISPRYDDRQMNAQVRMNVPHPAK